MGESRTELINWLNDLLALSYTKVEQCGSGESLPRDSSDHHDSADPFSSSRFCSTQVLPTARSSIPSTVSVPTRSFYPSAGHDES